MKEFYYKPARDIIGLITGLFWKTFFVVCTNIFFLTMVKEMPNDRLVATLAHFGNIFSILVAVVLFIWEIIDIYSKTHRRLIINSDDIVYRTGWLTKSVTTIPAYKIRSCTKTSSFLQRICGSMNIRVTTAGDSDEIIFYNIANGDEAYKMISLLAKKEYEYYRA